MPINSGRIAPAESGKIPDGSWTGDGFADGREKVGGQQLYAVDDDHEQEGPHKVDGKGKVGRIAVSEQGDDLARKSLEQDKSDAGDDEIVQDGQLVGLFYTVILPWEIPMMIDSRIALVFMTIPQAARGMSVP